MFFSAYGTTCTIQYGQIRCGHGIEIKCHVARLWVRRVAILFLDLYQCEIKDHHLAHKYRQEKQFFGLLYHFLGVCHAIGNIDNRLQIRVLRL